MNKWIAGFAAVLMAGVGVALTVRSVQAADEAATLELSGSRTLNSIVQDQRVDDAQDRLARLQDEAVRRLLPSQMYPIETGSMEVHPIRAHGAPGTWQIVNAREHVLLLNTASGETFMLEHKEGEARWKPIAGNRPAAAPKFDVRTVGEPRRVPLPPDVETPARHAASIKELETTLQSFDYIIRAYEKRLERHAEPYARSEIERQLESARTERKRVARELEEAKAAPKPEDRR